MIPYLLAIAGGYLIAQSRKQDTFADGGKIKYPKYHGSPYDRGNADSYYGRPKDPHYYPQGAYQGERITNLTEEELAAYNAGYDENFAKKDWGEFAKGGKMAGGGRITKGLQWKQEWTDTKGVEGYDILEVDDTNYFSNRYSGGMVVRSKIIESSKPERIGNFQEETKAELRKILSGKYPFAYKLKDGMMAKGGELPIFYSIAYLQKSPKGKTDWRNWDDEDWDIYAIRHLVYNGIADIEKIGKDEYRVTNLDEDDDYEAVYTGWEIRQLAFDYDLPDSTDLEEEDAIFLSKGGKVENELYVAEFRKGEWTVKDKKNPKGNYTLSSKKENAENVRQFLIDNPSRLKYYRTNEYAKGGKMANGMMADEDEMVYNYVKIKNYPTFQTEEEAKKFIKIGKPFLRKELKEGKIVLVHNGKEYYLAYVKEKMADGAMMERGGKIQTLIMQQNDLDPQGYTLVDYDKEKKEWYWEDYKADTYSSGFKSRKDAYEDLNEYLFKDTEYRYEGKEGTMGQKWPDLPTPTKSHSFREY